METPSTGLATIIDTFDGMEIIVPVRKNYFALIFLPIWLFGWLFGETFAIRSLLTMNGGFPPGFLFLGVWLTGWTIGGLFAIGTLIWNIRGRELVTINSSEITIAKQGIPFFKPKTYDLNEAKNFRTFDNANIGTNFYGARRSTLLPIGNTGMIGFDYGMKTVKFAGGIDEAEADYILQRMKSKKLVS